jgi:hypothetical protein
MDNEPPLILVALPISALAISYERLTLFQIEFAGGQNRDRLNALHLFRDP